MRLAHHGIALPIFIATICVSAFLLFSVQPIFAKMVLPTLGGAPAVWAVSLCFFQAMLVAGYGYAHLLERYLAPKLALVIHLALLASVLRPAPNSQIRLRFSECRRQCCRYPLTGGPGTGDRTQGQAASGAW